MHLERDVQEAKRMYANDILSKGPELGILDGCVVMVPFQERRF
jgi:hypothetical protein